MARIPKNLYMAGQRLDSTVGLRDRDIINVKYLQDTYTTVFQRVQC